VASPAGALVGSVIGLIGPAANAGAKLPNRTAIAPIVRAAMSPSNTGTLPADYRRMLLRLTIG
jgi:hypothetical protein